MSRDSFSARCHRHTNQMRLYWDCQTVRISIRMLVGRTERRTHAGENERNRKQTSEGKSRRSGSGRRTDTAIFFFFFHEIFLALPVLPRVNDDNPRACLHRWNRTDGPVQNKVTITNDNGRPQREEERRANGERSGKISRPRNEKQKEERGSLRATSSHVALT